MALNVKLVRQLSWTTSERSPDFLEKACPYSPGIIVGNGVTLHDKIVEDFFWHVHVLDGGGRVQEPVDSVLINPVGFP